jgi:hypothetical protein
MNINIQNNINMINKGCFKIKPNLDIDNSSKPIITNFSIYVLNTIHCFNTRLKYSFHLKKRIIQNH